MAIHPDINKVNQYVQQGEVAKAEGMCKHILSGCPGHADALHSLGVIAMQQGDPERALELIGQAIRIDSNSENLCHEINNSKKDARGFTTSLSLDHPFTRLNPDCADAHYNMGLALNRLGKSDDAIASFLKALEVNPGDYQSLYNLGCVFRHQGKIEQAIDFFQKTIELEPGHSSAYNNLGVVLNQIERTEEAIACFKKARALNSEKAEVHINLGCALQKQGCADEAYTCFEKALEVQPNDATAHYNMGVILKSRGLTRESIARFQKAVELSPDFAEAYCSLGNLFKDSGKNKDAIDNFGRAIEIKPDYAEAYLNLGNVYQDIGKSSQTVACCRKAIGINPNFAEAYNNLGSALGNQGLFDESISSYRKALELKPDYAGAHSNLLFQMNYSSAPNASEMMAEANFWWRQHGQAAANQFDHQNRADHGRLRIGYVSADFRQHSTSHFFLPLLMAHDNHVVETYCYSDLDRPDDITRRIQAQVRHWRLIAGMTDGDVARQIFEDQIDILIDLSGHTAHNRLLVFARKPAPVQATWLGYPNSTGLSVIDYRITDSIADPEGETDQYHSETLIRLPNGFLCYAPNRDTPAVASLPATESGTVTFGSFNNLKKINARVIALWSKILDSVSNSQLLLKGKQLSDEFAQKRVCELFSQNGICADRIKMLPTTRTIPEHLKLYSAVDIGLDPFPYNGTTTTCEAMWMGVPVISLCGDRHSSRVGTSILTRIGCEDLIVNTEKDYIKKAMELACNLKRLSRLRGGMRHKMEQSPLCDAESFGRDMERAYRSMWQNWCSGNPPGHLNSETELTDAVS